MEACESWTPRFFVSIPTINKIVHYDDVRFAPGIYFGIYTYVHDRFGVHSPGSRLAYTYAYMNIKRYK